MPERSNFFSMEQGFNKIRKSAIKIKDFSNEGKNELPERRMKLPILSTKWLPKSFLRNDHEQYLQPVSIKNVTNIKINKLNRMIIKNDASMPSLKSNFTCASPSIEIKSNLNYNTITNEKEINEINKVQEVNSNQYDHLQSIESHKRNFFFGTQNSNILKKHLLLSIDPKRKKPKINLQRKISLLN